MPTLIVLFAVATAVSPAAAQDRLDAIATGIDRVTAPPSAEAAAVERMASFLGVTAEALRAARASTRLGWGDVFISHRLATRGGHPIEKVFAARRTGTPWGAIAEEARVDIDALVQDVAALWPDAARATPGGAGGPAVPPATPAAAKPPAAPVPEDKKGVAARVREFLRGTSSDNADDKPVDRPSEEIRDRMIRGGGSRTR